MSKFRKLLGLYMCFPLCFVLWCCNDNDDDNKGSGDDITIEKIKGEITFPDGIGFTENYKVINILGESHLEDKQFEIENISSNTPQILYVVDENDDVIMMSRDIYVSNNLANINTKTTAMALISMHPLLATAKSSDFITLKNTIESSEYYQDLINAVDNNIKEKKDIFNEDNQELLIAVNNILNNLAESDLKTLSLRASLSNSYPISITTDGSKITFRNSGIAPTYYGNIYDSKGNLVKEDIPIASNGDLTSWKVAYEMISGKEVELAKLGTPSAFTFTTPDSYNFKFSCLNAMAGTDNAIAIIGNFLGLFGVTKDAIKLDPRNPIIKDVLTEMTKNWGNISSNPATALKNIGTVIFTSFSETTLRKACVGLPTDSKFITSFKSYYTRMLNIFNFYSRLDNAANMGLKIGWWLGSPSEIEFCAYYDGKVISSCTNSIINLYSGNNQIGEPNKKLLESLEVKVTVLDDKGLYVERFSKVKFKIEKGKGSLNREIVETDEKGIASVEWTMGDDLPGEKVEVSATVVDLVTGDEISEPVIFTATIRKTSDITVRLDWTSNQTDLDLHVIDPNGEEIYFANPTSYSGGYLDRDDLTGPGPEHIIWENAMDGVYYVYVHFYGSEVNSISPYRVKINALDQERTFSGSIKYDEYKYIASITISNNTLRSSGVNIINETIKPKEPKIYIKNQSIRKK